MNIDEEKNILYFDNDDEFYEYCVNLDMVAKVRGRCASYSWDFTEWYYSHVDEETKIVILDDKSTILRRNGVVSGGGGVCKKINAYRAVGLKHKQILIKVQEE
jgi:hypothetical protein